MNGNVREDIVSTAARRMWEVGIKSFSVDDLVRLVGISKKTFYQLFTNKEELIDAVLENREAKMQGDFLREIEGRGIIEIFEHREVVMVIIKCLSDFYRVPSFIFDLRKYYPKLSVKHKGRIVAMMEENIAYILRKGQSEGVFRSDLDVRVASMILSSVGNHFLEESIFDENFAEEKVSFMRGTWELMLRGIVSAEGLRQLENKKNIKYV